MNITKNIPPTCKVYIYGKNNMVEFIQPIKYFCGVIYIGTKETEVCGCKVIIGAETTSNGTVIRLLEDNQKVIIGSDCMLSDEINIWASDTHTIFDESGNISNWGDFISIGNHVWIGKQATILKNTTIPDNSIIGQGAVVSGNFKEKGSIIAGNPGRVIRNGINWDRHRPNWCVKHGYKIKNT